MSANHQTNFILIGMPGAGKSTVGHLLAQSWNRPFVDTDRLIEERWGCGLQDIIDREGLDVFLRKEEAVISELTLSGHVVATGGSVVYSPQGMANLAEIGQLIWLDVPLPEVEKRLATAMEGRGVAMNGHQTIAGLYNERQPLYERYAHIRVLNSGKSAEAVLGEIERALSEQGVARPETETD